MGRTWTPITERLTEGLTFDDVLVKPSRSYVLPAEADITADLTPTIQLKAPFVSAPMDRVTGEAMACEMALCGGIGILQRYFGQEALLQIVKNVKRSMPGKIREPVIIHPDMTLREVRSLGVPYTSFPVTKRGEGAYLVGIATRRNIAGRADSALVENVMTGEERLVTAGIETSFEEALRIMEERGIEKLLLVGLEKKLLGLVTKRDIEKRRKHPDATLDAEGRLRVGVAVGHDTPSESVCELIKAGVDVVVIDSGHGGHIKISETTQRLKSEFPNLPVISGNVAEEEGARALIEAGADGLRVGVGPGSICTTRVVAGVGVPQITAIDLCRQAVEKYGRGRKIPIIADGGITQSGQVTKALAAGASTVMFGNLLAGTDESPGEKTTRRGRKVVEYRGMGSWEVMKEHGGVRYLQSGKGKLVPEGVSGTVAYRGSVFDVLERMAGGLRNGMGYNGAATIADLWGAGLIHITAAGQREGDPHDLESIEGEDPTSERSGGKS